MKKGFTLIELLAVIVILAVIALIATPIILNIIEDSRKSAATSSANLYLDGITKQIASKNMINEFNPTSCTITNGNVTCDGTNLDYEVNGTKPTSGTITLNNGVITGYNLCIMNYKVTKIGDNVTTVKDQSCSSSSGLISIYTSQTPSDDTHKGIVYIDPTDLSTVCTASDAANNVNDETTPSYTGVTSGCMKFYIYDDSGNDYKMILDHNTSGNLAWTLYTDFIAAGGTQNDWDNLIYDTEGPLTANARLLEDTEGWVGNPRLITADEIAHIVGADTALGWDSTDSNSDWFSFAGAGISYAWLYSNLAACEEWGCNVEDDNYYPQGTKDSVFINSVQGYWTSTSDVVSHDYAWAVTLEGGLFTKILSNEDEQGVRPVITLPKSLFSSTRIEHEELFAEVGPSNTPAPSNTSNAAK